MEATATRVGPETIRSKIEGHLEDEPVPVEPKEEPGPHQGWDVSVWVLEARSLWVQVCLRQSSRVWWNGSTGLVLV